MSDLLDYLAEHEKGFRKQRLPALYSDFRSQQAINPDGYHANISTWKQGLANAALAGKISSSSSRHTTTRNNNVPSGGADPSLLILHTGPNLVDALESKQFGRPLALGTVVRESSASGTFIPLGEYLSHDTSIYSKGSRGPGAGPSWLSIPTPSNAFWWTVGKLTGYGDPSKGEDSVPQDSYAVLPNLEAAGKAFLSRVNEEGYLGASPFERTFSRGGFEKKFKDILAEEQGKDAVLTSREDMDALLKFLSRDRGLIATDGSVVRIISPSSPSRGEAISEEDTAIASLRDLVSNLEQQTSALESRVDSLADEARAAVARSNKTKALAKLKAKKQTEGLLQTRYATLAQLHEVAHKLEQASDQVQLVRVMQSSASALRSLNKQTGGAEHVADVLDSLREQMGAVDEVGGMISDYNNNASTVIIDEGEVDDELEKMEREERRKAENKEREKREEEEKRKAKELEDKIAGLEPPTTKPVSVSEGEKDEVEAEAVEGMRRMSLEDENSEGRIAQAEMA